MSNKLPYTPGSSKVADLISGTVIASVNSASLPGSDHYSALCLHVKVASIGGTSPTFNVRLQQLAVDGATWYDIASMAQITANGSYVLAMASGGNSNFTVTNGTLTAGTILNVPFGGIQRVSLVVAGTNPTAALNIGIEYIE